MLPEDQLRTGVPIIADVGPPTMPSASHSIEEVGIGNPKTEREIGWNEWKRRAWKGGAADKAKSAKYVPGYRGKWARRIAHALSAFDFEVAKDVEM